MFAVIATDVKCPLEAPEVPNTYQERRPSVNDTRYNSAVIYTCKTGYWIAPGNYKHWKYCQDPGFWWSHQFSCVRE